MNLDQYLTESEFVDYSHPSIQTLAKELADKCSDDESIAGNCFLYVRDEIKHIGDYKLDVQSVKASEVLQNKAGWCYAKALLLAALLRANGIPTALCYQHLSCGEYEDSIYCLHGLNAIYLKKYGWYRVDARGNKEGVDAKFTPPIEKLAFELKDTEFNIAGLFDKPLEEVVEKLNKNDTYEKMKNDFPILDEFIFACTKKDALALSELSKNLLKYIFEGNVPQWFIGNFDKKSFEDRISSSEYKHFGYIINNKVVGYIAIRDGKHLYHLFVDEQYHKKGIAKKLWQFVEDTLDFDTMSTNSSLYALSAYKSFGFKVDGDIQTYNEELKYQPMVYKRKK